MVSPSPGDCAARTYYLLGRRVNRLDADARVGRTPIRACDRRAFEGVAVEWAFSANQRKPRRTFARQRLSSVIFIPGTRQGVAYTTGKHHACRTSRRRTAMILDPWNSSDLSLLAERPHLL